MSKKLPQRHITKVMPSDSGPYVVGVSVEWDRNPLRKGRKIIHVFWGDDEESETVREPFGMEGIKALHDLLENVIKEYDEG